MKDQQHGNSLYKRYNDLLFNQFKKIVMPKAKSTKKKPVTRTGRAVTTKKAVKKGTKQVKLPAPGTEYEL